MNDDVRLCVFCRTLKQTQEGLKIVIISCIVFAVSVTVALVITIAVLPPQASSAALIDITVIIIIIITCGSMAQWLAHVEFELGDPGSIPESCHYSITLGKLFTHIASPVSQLQETGVQKGVFSA